MYWTGFEKMIQLMLLLPILLCSLHFSNKKCPTKIWYEHSSDPGTQEVYTVIHSLSLINVSLNGADNSITKSFHNSLNSAKYQLPQLFSSKFVLAALSTALVHLTLFGTTPSIADDELAAYAANGNSVAVDGQCFLKKCALETSRCANDPSCIKGLSCLARCKGGSLCSTGCFAKFGSDRLDNLLYCSVEKNDCVTVPGKESLGWKVDTAADLPAEPRKGFDALSLQGTWYKVMGLDSRYDCFDCQRNRFDIKNTNTLKMEAVFRIPRQTYPGYLQSKVSEELEVTPKDGSFFLSNLLSKGRMFGLTFWENWYILGDTREDATLSDRGSFNLVKAKRDGFFVHRASAKIPSALASELEADEPESKLDLRLVYYTGHTLQGNYKGAFVYSRTPLLSTYAVVMAAKMIKSAGLNPADFCIIRNQCFLTSDGNPTVPFTNPSDESPIWLIVQKFFRVSTAVAQELADWFEDPAMLGDWLVKQQQRSILEQPLEVSPFAADGPFNW